jgi:hypothetical protein
MAFRQAYLCMLRAFAKMEAHDAACATCTTGSETDGARCARGAVLDGAAADQYEHWHAAMDAAKEDDDVANQNVPA